MLFMKKVFVIFLLFMFLGTLGADELLENLRDASSQVSVDIPSIVLDGTVLSGAITFENRPILLGNLFSDLLSNRLIENPRFNGRIVKGYEPGSFRVSDADWILSGSLYKSGTGYFLSLYLNDATGVQKKGWEFLLPSVGIDGFLRLSQMAGVMGEDTYEPNDSMSQAAEISPAPNIEMDNLQIGEAGDEDWFVFDVAEGGRDNEIYLLTAYTTGNVDTYLEVYAPSNTTNPVVENDDGSDNNASLSYALDETGRWYIKVRGYSSEDTGDYGLFIGMELREAGPGEPDGTMEQATDLSIEGDEIQRVMEYVEDYDYFRITMDRDLPPNKALVIETSSSLDLTMTLLDENGNEIITNDDSGTDSNPMIMMPGLDAGTRFVAVYPYDSDNLGDYTIRAYYKEVIRDRYEDDNTMEKAGEIEINGAPQVRTFIPANEEDWVRFTVDEASDFIMKTTGAIDTKITLYDSSGEYIYEDDDGGNDKNALISERLEPGVYFLQVTQYEGDGNIEENYSLSVRKY